jgi:hypothetical protein
MSFPYARRFFHANDQRYDFRLGISFDSYKSQVGALSTIDGMRKSARSILTMYGLSRCGDRRVGTIALDSEMLPSELKEQLKPFEDEFNECEQCMLQAVEGGALSPPLALEVENLYLHLLREFHAVKMLYFMSAITESDDGTPDDREALDLQDHVEFFEKLIDDIYDALYQEAPWSLIAFQHGIS